MVVIIMFFGLMLVNGARQSIVTGAQSGLFRSARKGDTAIGHQAVRLGKNMVPGRGLEPPRRCQRQHLKLVRLPIPPSGHVTNCLG